MPVCRKGRMHMRKKKKENSRNHCGLWNLCSDPFCAVSGTSAYLTDHEERINQITAGYNETGIEEEFPTPTPAAPGETIVKKYVLRIMEQCPVISGFPWLSVKEASH